MDISVLIKTFERPHSATRLIESVKHFYPDIPIVLVDDSKIPMEGSHALPFDSGVSKGRNVGVSKINTKYTFLCDDDCVFTRETDLERLQRLLEESGVDILGITASGVDYAGIYRIEGDTVRCVHESYTNAGRVRLYDFVPNIFLAKTLVLRDFPWDEELKIGEHFAYFFEHKGKIDVGFTDEVSIIHAHEVPEGYGQYRNRAFEYVKQYLRKKGLKRRIDRHSTIEV